MNDGTRISAGCVGEFFDGVCGGVGERPAEAGGTGEIAGAVRRLDRGFGRGREMSR